MTIKSISDKLYVTLNPTERRQLTIAALARCDEAEIEKLRRTCPMATYLMGDDAYFGTMRKIENIIAWYVKVSQYFHNKITTYEAYKFAVESSTLMLKAGFNLAYQGVQENTAACVELDQHLNTLTEAKNLHELRLNENIALLKAVHQGLINFCHENNIGAESLLKWINFNNLAEKIDNYLNLSVPVNTSYSKLVTVKLNELWR